MKNNIPACNLYSRYLDHDPDGLPADVQKHLQICPVCSSQARFWKELECARDKITVSAGFTDQIMEQIAHRRQGILSFLLPLAASIMLIFGAFWELEKSLEKESVEIHLSLLARENSNTYRPEVFFQNFILEE
ncbi:MAG: hypothetical protein A2096_09935 [Spirochaetes bacterium GWF1_41_5]|nr:MAG: hypothetical protein A2096_09935 [Spirochaetes bacterium GWF1_41_5]HBE03978.1 hypothetical protein [Spirochaetia bacterium]